MKRKQTKKSQQKSRWKAIQLVLKNIEWPDQLSMKRQGNCKSTYLWRWVHILYIHLNTNLFKRGEGIEVNSPFLFIKAKLPARTEHHQEKKKMNIIFFFQASSFQLLQLENSLRWSFFTFIYNSSSNMNYFIYFTSFHSSQEIWTQQIDLAPNVWFHSSVGTATHRQRGGHWFESRWRPDFFFFSGFFFPIA